MNKQFTRMQKLAGIVTEGLYTTQMDFKKPINTEGAGPVYVPGSNPDITAQDALDMMTKEGTSSKMTKEEFKSKIREMILAEKSLSEAKKKKDEEEVDVETEPTGEDDVDMTVDVPQPGDTSIDVDGDGTSDIDAGSSEAKKAFGDLTDAYRAAKTLGDEKLIRQIANTITYFNKNIILKP